MTEKLSAAQRRAIEWIKGGNARQLGALGTEIGKMLAELTADLADAKREAAHWKQSFETVRDELKVVASVSIHKSGGSRLVITKAEYVEVVKRNVELYVGQPDDSGMRIYELRERRSEKVANAVGQAINGTLARPN